MFHRKEARKGQLAQNPTVNKRQTGFESRTYVVESLVLQALVSIQSTWRANDRDPAGSDMTRV